MRDDDFDDFSPLPKKKKITTTKRDGENTNLGSKTKASNKVTDHADARVNPRKGLASGNKTKKSQANSAVKSCTQASSSKHAKNTIVSRNNKHVSKFGSERCPVCQMPLSLLRIESPEWHVTECLKSMHLAKEECAAGCECDNPIVSHYRKFKHTELANAVSRTSTTAPCESSGSDILPENQKEEFALIQKEENADDDPRPANQCPTALALNSYKIEDDCDSEEDIFSTLEEALVDTTLPDACDNETASAEAVGMGHSNLNCDSKSTDTEQGVSILGCDKNGDSIDDNERFEAEGSDGCDDDDDREDEALVLENKSEIQVTEVRSISPAEENLFDEWDETDLDAAESMLCATQNERNVISSQVSQNSQSCAEKLKKTPSKSESKPKSNLTRIQSSILSFFTSPEKGSKDSTKNEPSTSSNITDSGLLIKSSKSLPVDHLAVTTFMKQFNRKSDAPSTDIKAPHGRGRGSYNSYNSGTNDHSNNGGSSYKKKSCPFYKKIPGTPFTVDAFNYGTVPGCSAYFLSHFHYDHYIGLNKRFCHPVYCSKVTANLVKKKINVDSRYIHTLNMNSPKTIEGIIVTLLEANHCPGSVLFLFTLPDGSNVLHTGDFRADPSMELYPELQNIAISQLYLDTTYCDSAYAFPPQGEVIKATLEVTRGHLHQNPNTLIVVGAYTIGKERIFLAIAEEFNFQVCVTKEKQRILECQENPIVNKRMTTLAKGARLHVLSMKQLNYQDLTTYLEKFKGCYDNVLAFEPTGWTHSRGASSDVLKLKPKLSRNHITIYGVPYSEHSSFLEMKRFVQWCRPLKILPTVNVGSPASRAKMEAYFKAWLSETPTTFAKQTRMGSFLTQNK